MKVLRLFVCGIFFYFWIVDGHRILVVFPLPATSHGILGNSLVKHLLEAGHDVTYVTPFLKKDINPKLRFIDISDNKKVFNEKSINIKMIMDKLVDLQDLEMVTNVMLNVASNTMKIPDMQKLIHDPNEMFDVVIAEYIFSKLYSVFGAVFECPFIWLSTIEPHWLILNLVDGPTNPAYTNNFLSKHVHPLSFRERVYELWLQIEGLTKESFIFYYKEEEVYKRFIVPALRERDILVPSYDAIIYNTSLVLSNSYVALGDAFAMPHICKQIGGFHIDEVIKPLPENLKNLMDKAKNGVVYFSLGSNVKSKDLPLELKPGILEVFKNLKQLVIWKFEETLSDVPENVHIVQWAPQQSILAHKNTILFITHGGLLSVTEAVHFRVPLIAIPVFADQFGNALKVDKRGFGRKLDLSYTMHEELKIAIEEMLVYDSNDVLLPAAIGNPLSVTSDVVSNVVGSFPSGSASGLDSLTPQHLKDLTTAVWRYSDKVKEISQLYYDRPLSPKNELLFWIDHVVRTKGAQHLRSPALQLPLYQRLFLDLIAVVLMSLLIVKYILSCVLQRFGAKCLDINKNALKFVLYTLCCLFILFTTTYLWCAINNILFNFTQEL